MSFSESISSVFKQYATFSGRARRSEYWYFTLFNCIVSGVLSFLSTRVNGGSFNLFTVLSGLYSLAVLVPGLAVCWRRLHDIGKSGGYYFIDLIPVVGFILLIVWFCKDSEPGANQYGPNPKEYSYY